MKVTSQPKAKFTVAKGKTKEVENLNKMLPGGKYTVDGVQIDGLKTGTSDAAGACFTSTGTYQGHRLITVVLHANGKDKDARFTQTQKLYQYFIQNAHQQVLTLNKKQSQKRVSNGTKRMLTVGPHSFTVWQMQKTAQYTIQPRYYKHLTNHKARLNAPVKKANGWEPSLLLVLTLEPLTTSPLAFHYKVPKPSIAVTFGREYGISKRVRSRKKLPDDNDLTRLQ